MMADLTIVPTWACATNEWWERDVSSSDGRQTYRVVWTFLTPSQREKQRCQYGWHCSCANFKFKARGYAYECKHIRQVKDERCAWNAVLEAGMRPDKDETCPLCKGGAIAFRVGV